MIDAPLDLVLGCIRSFSTRRAFQILAYRFFIFRQVMALRFYEVQGSAQGWRLRERVQLSPAPEEVVQM